jgi:NADPH:quinone reductase-like Zn-dependent oxidoreductase
MKAIIHRTYGSPDVIEIRDVAQPVPADNEILVRVHAASLNRSDWEALTGSPAYARMNGLLKPRRQILGSDVAGTVEAVGKHHRDFQVGDAVFGEMETYSDGFAEYVCTRGNHWTRKPQELTFEQAAAIPQAGVIAMQGIKSGARRVLINGAGGGTGMFAIQLAKSYGAEVTGVDNGGKLDFMRSLGADHVIDYRQDDFTKSGHQYDLVLDLIADRSPSDYARALTAGGTYYAVGGSLTTFFPIMILRPWIRRTANKHVRILVVRRNREDLDRVTELCRTGKLVPVIDRIYPFDRAADALRALGEGSIKGKAVITLRTQS